nr:hypothetical protein [Sodalis ligni]
MRVLNASHSCVAWAGTLLGKHYVDESLLPDVQKWVRDYILQDVKTVLSSTNINLENYCDVTLKDLVINRFVILINGSRQIV